MTDISLLIAILGFVITGASFYIGRQSASRTAGKMEGETAADIRYIKEALARIEGNTGRLEGRVDEMSLQITQATTLAVEAKQSAKSAHNRLDEHLRREHQQTVAKRE